MLSVVSMGQRLKKQGFPFTGTKQDQTQCAKERGASQSIAQFGGIEPPWRLFVVLSAGLQQVVCPLVPNAVGVIDAQ